MKKTLNCLALLCCLLLTLALPAFAEGTKGEATITPDTPMKELRENPSIRGSGIYTYSQELENPCKRKRWENSTLREFVNKYTAEDCAKGLNRLIENYNNGIQISYKVYTEEEIAAQPERENAEIYYFPGSQPNGKYVLVVGGNALFTSAELREGVSTAERLNELGYTAFVLRYRVGWNAGENAPLDDLGHAVRYITQHAEEFGVQPEDYALVGFSSGGQITGLFGSDALGWNQYGVPKPGALLMAYAVNDFFELKEPWKLVIDPLSPEGDEHYYQLRVSDYVTPDYPPVYHWYGRNDIVLMCMNWGRQGPVLERALVKNNVPHIEVVYDNAPHKIGPGRGTPADGWLNDAVAFWEEQTAAQVEQPAA